MGGASSSGSVLANSAKRRDQLNKARAGLLDRPGLPPRSTSRPPAQAPAGDKKSPQEKSLEDKRRPVEAPAAGPSTDTPAQESRRIEKARLKPSPLGLDEQTRSEMKAQVEPFLIEQRKKQRSRLHKTIGRARRFFGGGF